MQISSKMTMAVHMLACAEVLSDMKVTSDLMASSIGTNPVIVRKLLQQLKAAGLIEVARGTGGISVTRPLKDITFLDIYNAVEGTSKGNLFRFHENPNMQCPVGRNIHTAMDTKLEQVQQAMEAEMNAITLASVIDDIIENLRKEPCCNH